MLVNTHKLIILLIFIGWNTFQAQEIWNLNQCIITAQEHNKTLKINRNNIEISNRREKEAKANLLPKISLNTDYKYFVELPTQLMPMNVFNPQIPEGQFKEAQFGVPHTINANVQLIMPLYNPQLQGAIYNSEILKELTQIQYQKTEEQLLYDITILYYNTQILKHQLVFIENNLANTHKLLKNIELLKEHLLAIGTDVSKVKLQVEQLNTQKENAWNKYIQMLNALKLNMGIELENEITVESDISFQNVLEYTPQTILDIRFIQKQNKLLSSELNILSKSRYLPTLNLIASYGTSGFGYDKSPDAFLKFYPIGFAGLQLTYPLFDGTVARRKIDQKKLEINNNELQVQLAADKNKVETENMSRQRTVAQQSITNIDHQITLAQSIYEQTILQQKMGTASVTDVLLADNALREAQQNYLSAVIDYLKTDLELKKLTGNLIQ